ncbi:MAG TPA: hydrogenase maturation nickel metallochaperone HypA [Thermoplasmata archaeon]|nr:hydrogenase maturation nickel metallochaperone HypA [Thermoplasmata archaeon]
MHEEAVLRDLVDRVSAIAREAGAGRVTRVRVWIGAFSHLTEATLRDRWPTATDGTAAGGSALEVEVSTDARDPRAQAVVLRSVDVAERRG